MIVVADLLKSKNVHVGVDSGILKVISLIFSDQRINFYCENELYNNITKEINTSLNINHKPILNNEKYSFRYNLYVNIIKSIYYLFHILINYNKSDDVIFILCMHPVTNYIYSKVRNFFSNSKIYIVLHGEIEQLDKTKERNKFWRQHFYTTRMLKNNLINSKYLVLGEVIKSNLVKVSSLDEENIISIDHPYIYRNINTLSIDSHKTIIISSIGKINEMKRSYLIFKLGEKLQKQIIDKKIELKLIGMIGKRYLPYLNDYASYEGIGNTYLDQEELEQKIMTSNYLIYFYDNDSYKFISSGAFFDAIKYEKPIIALKNDYFEYYFKIGGNIGFLCNDLEEMGRIIEKLVESDCNEIYNLQKNNIKLLKDKLSLEGINENLKKQLSNN
jgi:hypothetical protein